MYTGGAMQHYSAGPHQQQQLYAQQYAQQQYLIQMEQYNQQLEQYHRTVAAQGGQSHPQWQGTSCTMSMEHSTPCTGASAALHQPEGAARTWE